MEFSLHSNDFKNGETIDLIHTCEGNDISPHLEWSNVAKEAKSLVLIVDDPDAPDPEAPKMTWVHWILFNIPVNINQLSQGIKSLPSGTEEGINDWKTTGYRGPCPPVGRHRYFHKLYALDIKLQGLSKPNKAEIEAAMKGHIIAKAELIGTYQKSENNKK